MLDLGQIFLAYFEPEYASYAGFYGKPLAYVPTLLWTQGLK